MQIQQLYQQFQRHPAVQTDSRNLKEGEIFFALRGPNFNGNTFARQAIEKGATLVIVDEDMDFQDDRIIRVADSLNCLQKLAAFHRDTFAIPFIAITGSNGKTTTKELVHTVLSTKFKTYTTRGNLNNHIGIPLTILRIKRDAEMAVVEMGANHQQEIADYCAYAKPTHGLITNIGKAHLEGFGGEAGVKRGKGELFEFLKVHNGTAFVNADDSNIAELANSIESKISYGKSISYAEILSSDPFLIMTVGKNRLLITTKFVGAYNLPNVLAAYTVGRHFDVCEEDIKKAIESYTPSNSRSQLIKRGSNSFIMDAYNANPGSMTVAIENFAAMTGEKKVLMLGDMKELGPETIVEHEHLIDLIMKYPWHYVVLTGEVFSALKHPFISFENSEQAREWFVSSGIHDSLILVKGSRSMEMEKVLD